MFSIRVGGDTIEARLTALDTAVDGPLGDDPTGRSRDDLVEFFQRFETVLREAAAIGHRLIVETTERLIPGHLGCRSVGDFLIGTLRISGADATRRVKGAKKAGTRHSLDGDDLDPELPATAAAVKTGAIGPDHVAAVATILRKIPHGVGFDEITVAEKILADAACSATPEDVTKLGAHLLAHLNPDGDVPDEKERRRHRGLRIGTQGTDRMTPISGLLDPETRALLEPVLAKLARPGHEQPRRPRLAAR